MVVRVGFVVLLLDSYSRLTAPIERVVQFDSCMLDSFPRHYTFVDRVERSNARQRQRDKAALTVREGVCFTQ